MCLQGYRVCSEEYTGGGLRFGGGDVPAGVLQTSLLDPVDAIASR